MIPGMNLLKMASGVIGTQKVQWIACTGRTQNALGNWVTSYAEPAIISGSWQPVPRDRYAEMGLEESKSYFTLYTSHNVQGVATDRASDIIQKSSRRYEVKSVTPWSSLDGWNEVLCVDVGAAK